MAIFLILLLATWFWRSSCSHKIFIFSQNNDYNIHYITFSLLYFYQCFLNVIFHLLLSFSCDAFLQLLPHLTHLSIADMNILPVGLLNPFKHLRYLNISGNHLDVMSLQVIEPCQELEVSKPPPLTKYHTMPSDIFMSVYIDQHIYV